MPDLWNIFVLIIVGCLAISIGLTIPVTIFHASNLLLEYISDRFSDKMELLRRKRSEDWDDIFYTTDCLAYWIDNQDDEKRWGIFWNPSVRDGDTLLDVLNHTHTGERGTDEEIAKRFYELLSKKVRL